MSDAIIQITMGVLAVVGALLAAVGAFLFFMLHGMRRNQYAIWDWAKDETKEIARKVDKRNELTEVQLREMWRWMRHETRAIYGELMEITRQLGEPGKSVARSIRQRLNQMEKEDI